MTVRSSAPLRHRAARGVSLGSTLLVVAVLVTLAFALASGAVGHLGFMTARSNSTQAENLARSVVSEAMGQILANPTYGTALPPGQFLTATQPLANSGQGLLAFNVTDAQTLNIPYSTNNLQGTTQVSGSADSLVPPACVRLVGVGRCLGIQREVVAVFHVPPFPFGVASSGPIVSLGGLTVGGIASLLNAPLAVQNPSGLLPCDVVSDSAASESVQLGADTLVSGDVKSVGGIQLSGNQVTVMGQIEAHSDNTPLPSFNFSSYDPQAQNISFTPIVSNPTSPTYSGVYRYQSSSQPLVVNGGMTLSGGLVFVQGDIQINGGLSGTGALIVEGNVTITGGANFAAASQVALLTSSNLTITGSGQTASFFQGLIYSQGSVSADQISLIGTLICNPPTPSGTSVTLQDTNVLYTSQMAATTLSLTPPSTVTTTINASQSSIASALQGSSSIAFADADVGSVAMATIGDSTAAAAVSAALNIVNGGGLNYPYNGNSIVVTSSPDGGLTVVTGSTTYGVAPGDAYIIQALANLLSQALQAQPDNPALIAYAEELGFTPTTVTTPSKTWVVTIDPSQVLSLSDRIQLSLWQEF